MTRIHQLADPRLELEDVKQFIRSDVRTDRDKLSPRERRNAAAGIAENILSLLTDEVQSVATYASRPQEPDTAPLIELLHTHNIEVLLPVLGPGLTRDWAIHAPGDELSIQAPGRPPEPVGETLGETALGRADLVIVPALAVDRTGMRLGQGGGWYDRVLAHRREDAPVYAMVFDHEFVAEDLPFASHDRRVDGVVTPSGIHRIGAVSPETSPVSNHLGESLAVSSLVPAARSHRRGSVESQTSRFPHAG